MLNIHYTCDNVKLNNEDLVILIIDSCNNTNIQIKTNWIT